MRGRLALAACVLAAACAMAGPGTGGARGPLPTPVLSDAPLTREEEAEAERLYASAQASYEARRFFEVLRTTSELMERYPGSSVSGAALLMSARAELEAGAGERADAAAERYLGLLPAGDPRAAPVRILQAQAWQGDPALQLDRLLRIDEGARDQDVEEAMAMVRAATAALTPAELEAVLAAAPSDGPLATIPQVELAVDLLDRGQSERASQLARLALREGVREPERSLAEGVLRGELPPERARVLTFGVGMVLPESGPPALSEYARSVAEGVEVALATVLPEEYTVTLAERDDEANPALSALIASELELEGIAGAVGFLEDESLIAAAQARVEGLPIVSPTARSADQAGEGVFSLEGADPIAAREIARYAVARAYQRVAVILPSNAAAIEEADAFEAEAGRFGVPIVQRFYYEPGVTFFEEQVVGARNVLRSAEIAALGLGQDDTLHLEVLQPVAIFAPIPREDVEFLAPQIAHFALDTLGIELIGTSAWTDPGVLEEIDPLYVNGVVATSVVGGGTFSPGRERFRAAYEDHFQRTLVSSTPALGYDAALLLLEALRPGRIQPAQVLESFRNLRDVEGATGIFSVIDDRVVRRTEVVRIRNRRVEPVPAY